MRRHHFPNLDAPLCRHRNRHCGRTRAGDAAHRPRWLADVTETVLREIAANQVVVLRGLDILTGVPQDEAYGSDYDPSLNCYRGFAMTADLRRSRTTH